MGGEDSSSTEVSDVLGFSIPYIRSDLTLQDNNGHMNPVPDTTAGPAVENSPRRPYNLGPRKLLFRGCSEKTRSVKIGRGVSQGCCLSPILFKLYSEYLTKEALEGFRDFKVGG